MYEIFLVISFILFAGFAADIIFERTRISPVLVLIALGFVLGPMLHLVDSGPNSVLAELAPIIGALALIIMLFDGGISLPLFQLIRTIPKAIAYTALTFLATMIFVGLIASLVMGWDLLKGLLLGAVIGGTSSVVVIALVQRSSVSHETENLLTLESTLTDALCVISAIVLLQLITTNVQIELTAVLGMLASAFSVAILAGILAAVGWLLILRRLEQKNISYMLTLAAVIFLYAIVEAAGGNGAIAVFSFGLVLGNAHRLSDLLQLSSTYKLDRRIADMQEEVAFFTRTFFFVYLGMILNFKELTLPLVALALAFLSAIYICRRASLAILMPENKETLFISWMMPRGLAAAVLAGLPASKGVYLAGFTELTFAIIVLSNISATIGIWAQQKELQNKNASGNAKKKAEKKQKVNKR
jgi:NhaP-type Na+/H+ or K+/H+ antiporter